MGSKTWMAMAIFGDPEGDGVFFSNWDPMGIYNPLKNKETSIFGEHMDVSKNGGTPKWMVYSGKPY